MYPDLKKINNYDLALKHYIKTWKALYLYYKIIFRLPKFF